MKLRVMADLTRSDGIVRLHEVSAGGTDTIEYSAGTVGLTLAELQDRLVRAQADEYCRQRRGCSHCGSQGGIEPTTCTEMRNSTGDLVP
jgi:hypothetical protein